MTIVGHVYINDHGRWISLSLIAWEMSDGSHFVLQKVIKNKSGHVRNEC